MDDDAIFFGFGTLHDLRDAEPRRSRLEGLQSVKNHTTLKPTRKPPERRPMGFHQPRR